MYSRNLQFSVVLRITSFHGEGLCKGIFLLKFDMFLLSSVYETGHKVLMFSRKSAEYRGFRLQEKLAIEKLPYIKTHLGM